MACAIVCSAPRLHEIDTPTDESSEQGMKTRWHGLTRRFWAHGSVFALAGLLGACGGGEPIDRFVPTRLIVLGDESSVINPDGSKHTVNGLVSGTTTPDCSLNPTWIQSVGTTYSLRFGQCPGARTGPATALIYAAAGARVADIAGQISAVGSFGDKDLVTLLAGTNDVLVQYALLGTLVNGVVQTETTLTAAVEGLGETLAGQVNRVANAGGKILISTIPDLGLTPFALSEESLNPGRAAMLSRLTKRFNAKLRINIINDGRRIGLLLTDELVQAVTKNPAGSGYVNVTQAACDATLAPNVTACTTATLATGADAFTYLWANDRLLSPGGHRLLANLALSRAANNPF
jgi:outer membrane lipase/esterase